MTRRVTASHPDYAEIDRHQRMLCLLANRHMHAATSDELEALPWPVAVLFGDIEDGLQDLLSGGAFRDWLTDQEE